MLSHGIEREIEYSAKATLPLNSIGIIHSLPVFRIVLHFGIIFTHIYLFTIGEKVKKAYISLTSICFWRFMPKGEKVWAQNKRTAPPPNFKNEVFQIDILLCSKGEKVVSSKLAKPSWTLRGEFYSRGVLFKSKEKHLKQGEKISNLENASFNPSCTFDHLQKAFEKNFTKNLQKQN
jgi:hypothetical protein